MFKTWEEVIEAYPVLYHRGPWLYCDRCGVEMNAQAHPHLTELFIRRHYHRSQGPMMSPDSLGYSYAYSPVELLAVAGVSDA